MKIDTTAETLTRIGGGIALAGEIFKKIGLDFTAPEKWVDIGRAMGERSVPREGNTDSVFPNTFSCPMAGCA